MQWRLTKEVICLLSQLICKYIEKKIDYNDLYWREKTNGRITKEMMYDVVGL